GFEAVMQRITAILVFLWMLDALALVIISSK
ncbi:preprotein translocase subunit SecG, partial [Streptococcus suis]